MSELQDYSDALPPTPDDAISWTDWVRQPYAAPGSNEARRVEIADRFIALFDKALRARHCRVATGVEIECDLAPRAADMHPNSHYNAVVDYITEQTQHLQKEQPARGYKAGGFLNLSKVPIYKFGPGPIARAYRDFDCLEVVTRPDTPGRSVRSVDTIKRILAEATDEFRGHSDLTTTSHSGDRLHNAQGSDSLRFGSRHGLPYGEHINISLHRTDSDAPTRAFSLGKHNVTFGNLKRFLAYNLVNAIPDDLPLLVSSRRSLYRLQGRLGRVDDPRMLLDPNRENLFNAVQFKRDDKGKKQSKRESLRVEYRCPDSASNIHFTMLQTLANTYGTVETICTTMHRKTLPERLPDSVVQTIITGEGGMSPRWMAGLRLRDCLPNTDHRMYAQFAERSPTLRYMGQVIAQYVPREQQAHYYAMMNEFRDLTRQSGVSILEERFR